MAEPLRKDESNEHSARLEYLEKLLEQSRSEYRTLFSDCPVPIWEEDFSAIRKYVNDKRRKGVENIRAYLSSHQSDVADLARTVRVTDVNEATLRMYGAGSREELEAGLQEVFGHKTYDIFSEEIAAFAEEQETFTGTTINETLMGDRMHINLKMRIIPGYEDDWSRVLVFITRRPN